MVTLDWATQTPLETTNAHEFVMSLPDLIYSCEKKLEEAIDRRDLKQLFVDTMRSGIIREQKEKNPKATKDLIEAICTEELHKELIDLIEHQSVVRKWETTISFLKSKGWSAKTLVTKFGENT